MCVHCSIKGFSEGEDRGLVCEAWTETKKNVKKSINTVLSLLCSLSPSPSLSLSLSLSLFLSLSLSLPPSLFLSVIELTGDTAPDSLLIERSDVIVTTPEKWDGISRSWQNRKYVKV